MNYNFVKYRKLVQMLGDHLLTEVNGYLEYLTSYDWNCMRSQMLPASPDSCWEISRTLVNTGLQLPLKQTPSCYPSHQLPPATEKPSCNTALYMNTIQKKWIFAGCKTYLECYLFWQKAHPNSMCSVFANVNGLLFSKTNHESKNNHITILAMEMGNDRQEAER